jgi:hypothetical protein
MEKYKLDYEDLRFFFAGERAVKAQGDRFTPRLEGQKNNKTYLRYVEMGILYNALARTRQGLKGAILRKPVDITFPESQKDILDDIMRNGASFSDMTREITDDVLGYGRIGALVDIDDQERPYTALYDALSILKASKQGDQQEILLKEMIEQPDTETPGEMEWIEQRRELKLVDGVYVVSLFRKEAKSDGEFILVQSTPENPNPRTPTYKGRRMDFLPFTFFGSSANTPEPNRPPLLDLLSLLKGHWRLTISYQYGLFYASLPKLVHNTYVLVGISFLMQIW